MTKNGVSFYLTLKAVDNLFREKISVAAVLAVGLATWLLLPKRPSLLKWLLFFAVFSVISIAATAFIKIRMRINDNKKISGRKLF